MKGKGAKRAGGRSGKETAAPRGSVPALWLPARTCPACDRPLPFYAASCPFCGERLPRAGAVPLLLAAVFVAALAVLLAGRTPAQILERFLLFAKTPAGAFALALAAIALFFPATLPMPGLPRGGQMAALAVRAALLVAVLAVFW